MFAGHKKSLIRSAGHKKSLIRPAGRLMPAAAVYYKLVDTTQIRFICMSEYDINLLSRHEVQYLTSLSTK
jgi:hypothetical protein